MFTTTAQEYGGANRICFFFFFHRHFHPLPDKFKPLVSVAENTETVEFIGVLRRPDVL